MGSRESYRRYSQVKCLFSPVLGLRIVCVFCVPSPSCRQLFKVSLKRKSDGLFAFFRSNTLLYFLRCTHICFGEGAACSNRTALIYWRRAFEFSTAQIRAFVYAEAENYAAFAASFLLFPESDLISHILERVNQMGKIDISTLGFMMARMFSAMYF